MSDDMWTRDQKLSAISIAVAVIGIILNFIEPITDAIGPFYWVLQPFIFMALGAFVGFALTKSFDNRILSAKDAEIADLKSRLDAQESESSSQQIVTPGKPKYGTPSTDLVLEMGPVLASRVYRAYKKGQYIPLNEIEPCAINSIGSKDGLFEFKLFVNPFGQPLNPEKYGLTTKWIAFLDNPVHLKQVKTIASGFLSSSE